MKGTAPVESKMLDPEIRGTGDGGAAAIVAGLLALALIAVGCFYLFSLNGTSPSQTIDLGPQKAISHVVANQN
jgi:hypothetical protein